MADRGALAGLACVRRRRNVGGDDLRRQPAADVPAAAGPPRRDELNQAVHRPGPSSPVVRIQPSFTSKMPGNFFSQPRFAAGTYSRALASSPETPAKWLAMPTEWTSAAPGQVRS